MRRRAALPVLLLAGLVASAGPALADHTSPSSPLSPVVPQPSAGAVTAGEGTWRFVANLGPMQGTDLEFFSKGGATYVSGGTLGQGPTITPGFVGQRIAQLTDTSGTPLTAPKVVADHGSARCNQPATSATGLQHDVQAVPLVDTQVLVDTTDAVGRCHDTAGGGLEIIDVSGLGTEGFEVREIGLIRFNGLSHTVTADRDRPGILYNNGADFADLTWTDVVDIRSCMGFPAGTTLAEKRAACQPVVYRYPFPADASEKRLPNGTTTEPANCHDITYEDSRLYCAGLNATLILDVTNLLEGGTTGPVRGTPLPCTRLPGSATTNTALPEAERARITDCALKPTGVTSANPTAAESKLAYEQAGSPRVDPAAMTFLGTVNHPGRACPDPGTVTCNTNLSVRSTEGVAVSHEADPALGGDYMFVTDERGGGVLPPGATCAPGLDNPVGNGGLHVFDIRDPSAPTYALTANGQKAVYIGTSPTPSPTFCTIHVIEQVPGEQRIIAAYYDGGTKIVDYFVAPDGTWQFKETAAYRLPGANTWASEVFKVVDNGDGTNTYWFTSTSFALGEGTARGIDVFTWTGPRNAIGAQAPAAQPTGGTDSGTGSGGSGGSTGPAVAARTLPATGADLGLLALALVLLPAAVAVRVVRRRLSPAA